MSLDIHSASPAGRTGRLLKGPGHEADATSTFDQALGERVRVVRLHRGLSQRELSEAIGVSREHLQNYEKGGTRIHSAALWRLAKALQVRVGDLLENDEFSDPLEAPLTWRERELIALLRRMRNPHLQHAFLAFAGAIEGGVSHNPPPPHLVNDED